MESPQYVAERTSSGGYLVRNTRTGLSAYRSRWMGPGRKGAKEAAERAAASLNARVSTGGEKPTTGRGVASVAQRMVVVMRVPNPGAVVTEYLRYAGACGIEQPEQGRVLTIPASARAELGPRQSEHEILVKVYCPRRASPQVWADQQIGRLRSFGVPCVAFQEAI